MPALWPLPISSKQDSISKIKEFLKVQQLYNGARFDVFRGERRADAMPVILKVATAGEICERALFHEHAIASSLDHAYVPEPIAYKDEGGEIFVAYSDDHMEPMQDLLASQPVTLDVFLRLAIACAKALESLHAAHVLHKDVNPANIIVDATRTRVKFIDLELASRLSSEETRLGSYAGIRGTLAYIAPEQTGRINRPVDHRSDLYSLGATFFAMLTGHPPFEEDDPVALVHAHIARDAPPVSAMRNDVPAVVADIVARLLAKGSEERYQSAAGLRLDLERCLEEFSLTGSIAPFTLAEHDVPEVARISQKLYGRAQEIGALHQAFAEVAAGGVRMLVVSGPSGVGKTALIKEVHRPMTIRGGNFAFGKYDQLCRDTPYAALVEGLTELCRTLAQLDQPQVERWRERISEALEPNAAVICEVIPTLERILGTPSPVPELQGREAHNRFEIAFRKFIRSLCDPEHPLVLVADDLQWADLESFSLLSDIVSDPEANHLLLIVAHRSEEVSRAHPLYNFRADLDRSSVEITELSIGSLEPDDVNQMLADTLRLPTTTTGSLARCVAAKTNGNAFFVHQFLKSILDDGLITYDAKTRRWVWDEEVISRREVTTNVVTLLQRQIEKLPAEVAQALHIASCVGNIFAVNLVSRILQLTPRQTVDLILPAVEAGLVSPVNDDYKYPLSVGRSTFRFLHDSVQSAAYAARPPAERQATHLQVSRIMTEDSDEGSILDVADQLSLGIALVTGADQKLEAARILEQAGHRARTSSAFAAARVYFSKAIDCTGVESFESAYEFCLKLYLAGIEAHYLTGDFKGLSLLVESAIPHCRSLQDECQIREIEIAAAIAQNKRLEAIELALGSLRALGIDFSQRPTQEQITRALDTTASIVKARDLDTVITEAPMSDTTMLLAMRLMATATSAAFVAAPGLMVLLILKQVELSLLSGIAPQTPYAFVFYGVVLCGIVGDIDTGYRFGRLATGLLDRIPDKRTTGKVEHVFNDLVRPWKEHIRASLRDLLANVGQAADLGDVEFAAYSAHIYSCYLFLSGRELNRVAEESSLYTLEIERLNQHDPLQWNLIFEQTIWNLRHASDHPWELVGAIYDESSALLSHIDANDQMALSYLYINKGLLAYLFNEYEAANESIQTAAHYLGGATGKYTVALHCFLHSLSELARCESGDPEPCREVLALVAANQQRLAAWARSSPANFAHKFALVEAELARVEGRADAVSQYERAIEAARAGGFRHEEALAAERAALFYLAMGARPLARHYLSDAHRLYRDWGARAKCVQLRRRYPQLLNAISRSSDSDPGGESIDLDQLSIAKASQTISEEVQLDQLLGRLVSIAAESAGADKAVLILMEGDGPRVQARRDVEKELLETMQDTSLATYRDLPATIVETVIDARVSIVLSDAVRDEHYWSDAYIRAHRTRSVLCIPVEHHSELVGVLYLENSKLDNVFGARTLSVIRILASQAAISITNARLIDGLRKSETRFELAMDASYDGLWDWDVSSDSIYLSPGWRRLLGHDHEGVTSDIDTWEESIRSEDRPRVRSELEMLVALEKDRSEIEIQMQHASGRWLEILSRAQAVRDASGKTVRVVGTHQDITERKQAEQQIKKDLAERELLLRELYHRTKNNMQVIVSLLRMREHDTEDAAVHQLVSAIADKIQSMALVHQMLYESNNLNQIDLGEYVEEFAATVFGSGDAYDRRIRLEYEAVHCLVSIDLAVPLGMVLSELISNSVKHAFPDAYAESEKIISIAVTRDGDRVRIMVRDNGAGIETDRDLRGGSSMGLQTVFALVEHQLGGTITHGMDDGLVWTIEVDARDA